MPEIVWGPFHIKNVLFVSRPDETFSDTSFETPSSITGALGGNVLKAFRVEIDYPHGITYLQQETSNVGHDMNSVGLVLDVDTAKHLVVLAIFTTAAALTKMNIHPGDQILEIGGKRERQWTIVDASEALSGTVGTPKRLVIKKAGKEMQTTVVVASKIENTLWAVGALMAASVMMLLLEIAFAALRRTDDLTDAITERLICVQEMLEDYQDGRPVDASSRSQVAQLAMVGISRLRHSRYEPQRRSSSPQLWRSSADSSISQPIWRSSQAALAMTTLRVLRDLRGAWAKFVLRLRAE